MVRPGALLTLALLTLALLTLARLTLARLGAPLPVVLPAVVLLTVAGGGAPSRRV